MSVKYNIENLSCANCALKIEDKLKSLDGIKFASLNFATATLKIDSDDIKGLEKIIQEIEPEVTLSQDKQEEPFNLTREIFFIAVSVLFFTLGLIFKDQLHNTSLSWAEYAVFAVPYLLMGWKVLYKAIRNILKSNFFDENFLMSIATLGAVAIHEIPEAVGVMLFFKVGETFEDYSLNKSRKSIQALVEIQEESANLVQEDGSVRRVDARAVTIDSLIIVKTGEKVPLDGIITRGTAFMDSSALTGESVPRNYKEQDEVLSGLINQDGVITVQVKKVYQDSTLSKIIDLTENAITKKAKTEKFITKFARYYTPIVVGLALLVAIVPPLVTGSYDFSSWIYRALILLVISCPCALVISIPLGYFGGIGAASKEGILIKGSNYLDLLTQLRGIAFDKTGTLTRGIFKVQSIENTDAFDKDELLRIAAHVESLSTHPIARAIVQAFDHSIDHTTLELESEIAGQGLLARFEGKEVLMGNDRLLHERNIKHPEAHCDLNLTQVYISIDGVYAGYLVIADEIKPDAAEAIQQLKDLGVNDLLMLTGDNDKIAADVAGELSLSRYQSELLPQDKLSAMEQEIAGQTSGHTFAFVGDGVNDAPVLARSDIGIAMGGLGSDAAIELADIVIMDDSLHKIPRVIEIARFTRKIILQNIILAFAVKAVFIALGIAGMVNMWAAVFADVGMAIIAILNAARIVNRKVKSA